MVEVSAYVTKLLDSTTTEYLEDVVGLVIKDYQEANDWCEERFESAEAHDVRPHVRRGLIEQDLRSVSKRHGYTAEARTNSNRGAYHTRIIAGGVIITESNVSYPRETIRRAEIPRLLRRSLPTHAHSNRGAYHTRIIAGGVIITESNVSYPRETIRRAEFRDCYVEAYQLMLFDDQSVRPDPNASAYAVLIHGEHPLNPAMAAFIHMVFPVNARYVARLDLIEYLQKVGTTAAAAPKVVSAPVVSAKRGEVRQGGEESTA